MTEKQSFYITTIYYPSGKLHIGSAIQLLPVMFWLATSVSWATMFSIWRVSGWKARSKIQQKAEEAGVTPQAYVDGMAVEVKELWEVLGISYDKFIRLTLVLYEKVVADVFERLLAQDDI